MSGNPLFSIITVCRNEREKIRATCERVCGQTFRDFEWIVIDGASTDGTLDILAEYKDRISVLVSEPDSGIYEAMNKGIERASGQYLVFLNGGDCFADQNALGFEAEVIKRLESFQWWNKSEEWMQSNVEKFQDITQFLPLISE